MATANPQAPGGIEVTEPVITRADRAGGDAAGRAVATGPERLAAHAARPRPGDLAAPGPAGEVGAGGRLAARLPRHPRPGRLHRDPHPEVRGVGDRVRGQRVRGRLLRPAGVPGPEPAVLQAADGRGVRARLRGRAGVPGRAARHGAGTWRSTSRWTPSSASSRTTATCCGCSRDVLAGMVAAIHEHAGPAVELSGAEIPVVPEEIPVIHFRDALKRVGAPADEPDLAPEHERALGAWAREEHGSDFVAVEGYPMAKRPFYTHAAARRPPLVEQLRPALPRAGTGHRRPAPAPRPRRTARRSAPAARTRRRTRRTCRPSSTACRRTAGSRSGSSAGPGG